MQLKCKWVCLITLLSSSVQGQSQEQYKAAIVKHIKAPAAFPAGLQGTGVFLFSRWLSEEARNSISVSQVGKLRHTDPELIQNGD